LSYGRIAIVNGRRERRWMMSRFILVCLGGLRQLKKELQRDNYQMER
jgi:hypothetical protein